MRIQTRQKKVSPRQIKKESLDATEQEEKTQGGNTHNFVYIKKLHRSR